MPKTVKKTERSSKSMVQVEVTAVVDGDGQELVGTDAETVGDTPTEDVDTQAGGSELQQQGQGDSTASKEGSQETDSSVERVRLRLKKTGKR